MAVRRIWIIVGVEPMADGTVTVEIEDDGDTRYPAYYKSLESAQRECEVSNGLARHAFAYGQMDSLNEVRVCEAWLVDETGIISARIEHDDGTALDIPDLQLYCEQQGLV